MLGSLVRRVTPLPERAETGRVPRRRAARALSSLIVASTLCACASPTDRLRELAAEQGFWRRSVISDGFELTVFENGALGAGEAARTDLSTLHVYLEGDGTPWRYRVIVMPDPTPRRPLMLHLMALDEAPAAYLGRPCYNGSSSDEGCVDRLWTSERYSAAVVDSMAGAVRSLLRRHGASRLRLFGHSGGGALALLLAARLPATVDVVTVAGNLDSEAWTRHHGYTPLRGSLNPAREAPLDVRVRQWHLVGGADAVVPPTLTERYIRAQPGATGVVFPSFSHGCCWARIWPGVLRAVTRDDTMLLPGEVFTRAAPRAVVRDDR